MKSKQSVLMQCCSFRFILLVVAIIAAVSSPSKAIAGQVIAHNTPGFAATAKKLGPRNPADTVRLSLWLRLHDQASLEQLAHDLYDPQSPKYRHWLKSSDIRARFAPTDGEVATVKQFLLEHNLRVGDVGPNNYFVRAEGTVADVEKAFAVDIERFQVGNEVRSGNTQDPYIEGSAGALVAAVYGLDDGRFETHYVQASDVLGGNRKSPAASATPVNAGLSFSNNCFPRTTTRVFSTNGGLPAAIYTGNVYNPNCGYSPQDIYTAYNFNGLYNQGIHGEGQTIVIIDWCVDSTIQTGFDAFNTLYRLPSLTLNVIPVPKVAPSCTSLDLEPVLDVEWAHAVAPGANIDLVGAYSASFADVDEATTYAINYGLGNVISGSYGSVEAFTPPTVVQQENVIALLAAVSGIAANYSSGDYGDYAPFLGGQKTVSVPAASPFATAVGGVSLALNSDRTMNFQAGWGTNLTELISSASSNYQVFDPPFAPPFTPGFQFGSGGGHSQVFAKPAYQKYLLGSWRKLPDISWLADPFTGVQVAYYWQGTTYVTTVGGTSLACPMFSALWAIANQQATVPLGQAAPYLYSLPAGAIADVLPYSSATNLKGTIIDSKGTTNYSAKQLAALSAPFGDNEIYSALWHDPSGFDGASWFDLSFETDTSLVVKPGWDDVTGLGTPNPQAFVNSF